jgi:hypothetical protein
MTVNNNYSWRIPAEWNEGLNAGTAREAEAQVKKLEVLVKGTLRANPDKGVTIELALKTRGMQVRQLERLRELLAIARPVNHAFFEGKLRFPAKGRTQQVYLAIIQTSSEREFYVRKQVSDLLKGYERFVQSPKKNVSETDYTAHREREFLERVLTALLMPGKFDDEFGAIHDKLTNQSGRAYRITACKILNCTRVAIQGNLVDRKLRTAYSDEERHVITEVLYPNLDKV